MKSKTTAMMAFLCLAIVSSATNAQSADAEKPADSRPQATVQKAPLTDVLDAVSKNSSKTFLISHRVQATIVIGQARVASVDYPMLLQILRNNDLAAVTVDDIVNVIPVAFVRQYPLPMIADLNDSASDEEWVTGVLRLENAFASQMIPILRPIMPQAGHLSANPMSNSVIIVDRLGNARRVFSLMQQMEEYARTSG